MVSSKLLVGIGAALLVSASAMCTILVLDATGVTNNENKIELKLQVVDKKKVYDGTPLIADDYEIIKGTKLLEGHKIVPTYIGSITNEGKDNSTMTCEIYSYSGELVTSEYKVSVVPGKLEVEKRPLSVLYNRAEVQYGSQEDYNASYELEDDTSVVEGHKIIPSVDTSSLNVGDETRCPVLTKVYDVLGNEVTGNYDIQKSEGTIHVTARKIEFVPKETSKIYDSFILDPMGYEIRSGELMDGHTAEVSFKDAKSQCGSYELSLEVNIYDESRNNVTNLYEYNKNETFKCSISKNAIELDMRSFEKDFDGSSFEDLISDHLNTLTVKDNEGNPLIVQIAESSPIFNFIDAGKYTITSSDFEIYSAQEKVLVENYAVKLDKEYTLTIKKVHVNISFTNENYSKKYDGVGYQFENSDIKIEFDAQDDSPLLKNLSVSNIKCENNLSYFIPEDTETSFRVKLVDLSIYYDGKQINNSLDYSLENVTTNVEIEKKDIQAKTKLITVQYDPMGRLDVEGTEGMNYLDLSSIYLATGDVIETINSSASFEIRFSGAPKSYTEQDAGILTLKIVNSSGVDVSSMYDMKLDVIYQITKPTITIVLPSLSKTYDGQGFDLDQYDEMLDAINTNLQITLNAPEIGSNVGSYIIDGDDVNYDSTYYNVIFVPGTLTISPKVISLTLPSLTKEYDGETFNLGEAYSSDDLTISYTGVDFVNAGTYSLTKANLDYVQNNNYDIQITQGSLVITPKVISLTLPSLTKEYDGETFDLGEAYTSDDITISYTGVNYINAGTYSLTKDNLTYTQNNNYEIQVSPGSLTINKKIVNVTLPSLSKTYDGEGFGIDDEELYLDDLGYTVSLINTNTHKNAGIYILDSSNVKYTTSNNYLVNVTNGSLEISKKTVNIQLPTISKEYDGAVIGLSGDNIYSDDNVDVSYKAGIDSYIDAGTYSLSESLLNIPNNPNYNFVVNPGLLTIYKKKVTINLPSISKTYDGVSIDLSNEELYTDGTLVVSLDSTCEFENVGTYIINSSKCIVQNDTNYEIFYNTGFIQIQKKDVVITLNNLTVSSSSTVTETDCQALVTVVGLVNGDTYTTDCSVYESYYTATVSIDSSSNYNLIYANDKGLISKI